MDLTSPGQCDSDEDDPLRNFVILDVHFIKAAHAFCNITALVKGDFEISYGKEINILGLTYNPIEDYEVGHPFRLNIKLDREKRSIFGNVESGRNKLPKDGRPVKFTIVSDEVFDISNRRYLSEVTIADALRERLGKSQVVVQEKPHSSADRNQYQQEIVLNVEGGHKSTLKRHRSEKFLEIYSSEQSKTINVEYESDDDIGVLINKINIKRRKTDGLRKIYNLTQITLMCGDEKLQMDQLVKDILFDFDNPRIILSIDRPSQSRVSTPVDSNSVVEEHTTERAEQMSPEITEVTTEHVVTPVPFFSNQTLQVVRVQPNSTPIQRVDTVPVRLIILKVALPSSSFIELSIAEDATLRQLKELVLQKLNEGVFDVDTYGLPTVDNLRLVRLGTELQPNEAALVGLNLANNDTLISQWPPRPIQPQQGRVINQNLAEEADGDALEFGRSEEATKIRNLSIFQRNFKECVKASKRRIDPNDRIRFNDPAREPPPNPVVSDLGDPFDDIGNALLEWSEQLHKTADVLVADPRYGDNVDELNRHRRLIDNNMQAARYLTPVIKHLTNFIIPIDRTADNPRRFRVQRNTEN